MVSFTPEKHKQYDALPFLVRLSIHSIAVHSTIQRSDECEEEYREQRESNTVSNDSVYATVAPEIRKTRSRTWIISGVICF